MATLNEGKHNGEYIVSEANKTRSREAASLASGNDLSAASVVGVVATATTTAGGSNTGNGTAGAVTFGKDALEGKYNLTCTATATNAGTFRVVSPEGNDLADLTVGTAYAGSHINLTISDGSTDFAVNDTFEIEVSFKTGDRLNVTEYDPAATNGGAIVAGVLFDNTDASTAAQNCVVIRRDAEVRDSDLAWKTGLTADQIADAKLAMSTKLGIEAR